MRAFVALQPPPAAVEELEAFLEPRAEASPDWRWVPPENFHVTLAFLGDVDDDHLDRLIDALADVARRQQPLQLAIRGAGAFGSITHARHLYAGIIDPGGGLELLAERVRVAAARAGCNVDKARFTPHLTVARGGGSQDATHLWRALDTFDGARWPAREFGLFSSALGAGREGHPAYAPYETFPLGAA